MTDDHANLDRLLEGFPVDEAQRLRAGALEMAARIRGRGEALHPEPREPAPDPNDDEAYSAWMERDFAWFQRNEWLGACTDLGWDPDNPGFH